MNPSETDMAHSREKKKNVRLSVTIAESDHSQLTQMAAENDLSLAWMVRRAVAEFVERNRNASKMDVPFQHGRPEGEGRHA